MSSDGSMKMSSCWNWSKLAVTAGTRQMDSILVQYLNPRVSPDNWRKYANIINIHQGHMQYAVVCVKGVYMRWVCYPTGSAVTMGTGKDQYPTFRSFSQTSVSWFPLPLQVSTLFFSLAAPVLLVCQPIFSLLFSPHGSYSSPSPSLTTSPPSLALYFFSFFLLLAWGISNLFKQQKKEALH